MVEEVRGTLIHSTGTYNHSFIKGVTNIQYNGTSKHIRAPFGFSARMNDLPPWEAEDTSPRLLYTLLLTKTPTKTAPVSRQQPYTETMRETPPCC